MFQSGGTRVEFDLTEYSQRLVKISEADDVVAVRAGVMDALAMLGIRAAYFIAPLTADPRIGRLLTNIGLPRLWERHYRARLYLVDPLPGISLRSSASFTWPEETDAADLSEKERHYLVIASKFAMGRGIGVACYGPHGRSGFLGAQWLEDNRPPRQVQQGVHMVGQASFQRYCQLVQPASEVQPLSNRELEVLSWMREGKSNSVIAQILDISRASVDMYVRRIFAKLDVSDRTAACLRGYSMGLIVSNEHKYLVDLARERDPEQFI